jgi:hypothetical protein
MHNNVGLHAPCRTVAAVILPGWMLKEDAVRLLTTECVEPHFDASQAEEVWEQYRRRVEELPDRDSGAPQQLALSGAERHEAAGFLHRARQAGQTNVLDVIKIDHRRCVVWQLQVVTERSENYARNMNTPLGKIKHCLGLHSSTVGEVQIFASPNDVRLRVPHAEFMFNFVGPMATNPGGFQVQEMAKHIATTAFDGRLLLWAGYHRSFALMTNEYPEGMDRSLVAVLTTDGEAVLSPHSPNQGVREMLRGLRPPLFADFLDERFCMRVRLRKRRCELWIQGRIMWFDDES